MNSIYRPFQPTLTETGLERFGLELQSTSACKVLRGSIHSYLQVSTASPSPYPVIPDGTQAVFMSPAGSVIGGAQTRAGGLELPRAGDYFGIRFYPGALRHFFNLNLGEITDQFADHQFFPCRQFAELHEQVYREANFRERARVCEQWLLKLFTPRAVAPFERALSLIYQSMGKVKIGRLAATVGCGSRQLNRLFRQHTGLDLKTFAQTIRIQRACERLYESPRGSLQIALDLGFFDQSHLIKDFRKRLLMSPGAFFNQFSSDFYN